MTEKLKIYVPAHVMEILDKDTEAFEFFKSDGLTFNRNALVTALIVNYYTEFQTRRGELFAYLEKAIGGAGLPKDKLSALCTEISRTVSAFSSTSGEKLDCVLSIKPTKSSQPVIDYIEGCLLNGYSLSEYFRNMLASYANLPQDEREKIIFKPAYEALTRAIKNGKKVFLSTSGEKNSAFEAEPYALCRSKEELHCYLLAVAKDSCRPIRLSRITGVTVLDGDCAFSADALATFSRMTAYGPQFVYKPFESEVAVELTEQGVKKFKKIYVHRPAPVRVDGNVYYFKCSYTQIVQYFVRFGEDALVLYPKSVVREVTEHHKNALQRYGYTVTK